MNLLVAILSITNILGIGIIIWLYMDRMQADVEPDHRIRERRQNRRSQRTRSRAIQFLAGFRAANHSTVSSANNTNLNSGVHERRQSVFDVLPAPSEGVVFLGDSMIQTCEWSELLPSFRGINRGIAGDTVADLLVRLPSIIELKPLQIVLMAGINNLRHETCDLTETLDQYQALLTTIATQLPDTKVIVHSVLPISPTAFAQRFGKNGNHINPRIALFNQQLQSLVTDYGFLYLDLASRLRNENNELTPDYTVDGLHLSGDAYVIWAKQLTSVLSLLSCSTASTLVQYP